VLWWRCSQILYYDGQFDDARLNVALATTAAAAGAAVANYVEATGLIKVRSNVTVNSYSITSVLRMAALFKWLHVLVQGFCPHDRMAI
jgi:hypothetical protein